MPNKTNGPDGNADVQRLTDANAELEARLEERTTALHLAEDRLKVAQRISKAGSWERSLDTGQVWWSEELYHLYGEDPETFEPTLDEFMGRVHPDDRSRVKEEIKLAWDSGQPYAWVDSLLVLPKYKGQGIGAWLCMAIEGVLVNRGIKCIRAVPESEEVVEGLQRSGFHIAHHSPVLEKFYITNGDSR